MNRLVIFLRLGVGMQGLRGEIRSTSSRKLYWDIDMVNAHPVLLLQVCQKNGWKCDTLDYYVSNREKYYRVLLLSMNFLLIDGNAK